MNKLKQKIENKISSLATKKSKTSQRGKEEPVMVQTKTQVTATSKSVKETKKAPGKIAIAVAAMTPFISAEKYKSAEIIEKAFAKVKEKGVAEGTVRAQLSRGFRRDGLNNFEFVIKRHAETKVLSFTKNRPMKPAK